MNMCKPMKSSYVTNGLMSVSYGAWIHRLVLFTKLWLASCLVGWLHGWVVRWLLCSRWVKSSLWGFKCQLHFLLEYPYQIVYDRTTDTTFPEMIVGNTSRELLLSLFMLYVDSSDWPHLFQPDTIPVVIWSGPMLPGGPPAYLASPVPCCCRPASTATDGSKLGWSRLGKIWSNKHWLGYGWLLLKWLRVLIHKLVDYQ